MCFFSGMKEVSPPVQFSLLLWPIYAIPWGGLVLGVCRFCSWPFEHVLEWWHGGSGRSRWSLRQCLWFLRAFMKCVIDLAVYVYSGQGTYRGRRKYRWTGISRSEDHCVKMGTGTCPPLFRSQHHHYDCHQKEHSHTGPVITYWSLLW